MLGEPCLQRLQPPASAADPVCQGRAIDLDTLPGEDLALPVKRQVIAVFGAQDMREKTGSGEALGDRTLWGGRLVDGPAGPAAIARPADADDPKPRRHVVQHLADGLADGMKLAAQGVAGYPPDRSEQEGGMSFPKRASPFQSAAIQIARMAMAEA